MSHEFLHIYDSSRMMYIHKADGSCCPQEETADEMFGLCGTEDDEAMFDRKPKKATRIVSVFLIIAFLFILGCVALAVVKND